MIEALVLLLVLLIVIGTLPVFPYNRSWGYSPLTVVVIILVIILATRVL